MADREDPLVAFKFGLEIEGKLSGLREWKRSVKSECFLRKGIFFRIVSTSPDISVAILVKTDAFLISLKLTSWQMFSRILKVSLMETEETTKTV